MRIRDRCSERIRIYSCVLIVEEKNGVTLLSDVYGPQLRFQSSAILVLGIELRLEFFHKGFEAS